MKNQTQKAKINTIQIAILLIVAVFIISLYLKPQLTGYGIHIKSENIFTNKAVNILSGISVDSIKNFELEESYSAFLFEAKFSDNLWTYGSWPVAGLELKSEENSQDQAETSFYVDAGILKAKIKSQAKQEQEQEWCEAKPEYIKDWTNYHEFIILLKGSKVEFYIDGELYCALSTLKKQGNLKPEKIFFNGKEENIMHIKRSIAE